MSKTSGDQKYCSYLFQELCIGILTCYEELIKRLLSNQPLTISAINKTASISDSNIRSNKSETPFRTVHQATEEYEYFKVLLLLFYCYIMKFHIMMIFFSPDYPSSKFCRCRISSETSIYLSRSICYVRREDLLKVGQLLSTMIQ